MDDFEICPYEKYNYINELTADEKNLLDEFAYSFRETFFKKGEFPKVARGIGILKYKGTILRTKENSEGIQDKIKILFLLLKLHISHDFFNTGMNYIDIKSFDIFGFNFKNNLTDKFGNLSDVESIYSTIPENINGIGDIKFFPLRFCINLIPVEYKFFKGWESVFGMNLDFIDITYLYQGITKNADYQKQFLNISSIYYGLEQQNDLFFYYSIIPSIIEVLNPPNGKKKESGIQYGKKLDSLIFDNQFLDINTCGRIQNLGLIARTISTIYDTRNELLHEGKRSFNKLKVQFKGYDLRIYDIFQLILKYTILYDFIDKKIIHNDFSKVIFKGNIWSSILQETGVSSDEKSEQIQIIIEGNKKLYMDEELNGLLEKAETDNKLKNNP